MNLNKIDVVFDQEAHTYHLGHKQLTGITTILTKHLFPRKYDGIDTKILDRAKSRGTIVHETIELVDGLGVESDLDEVIAYQSIKAEHGLTTYANEYLVSDLDHVASSIDIVFDDCTLADIKTTSKLDKEYVSWQLSIYAYLFELQNPTLKANRLCGIWLPKPCYGKPALIEVERKPTEWVKELILCDKEGRLFNHKLL